MFKVGDKVKVIAACWNYPTDKVGSTAKVLAESGVATLCEFGFTAPAFHNGLGCASGKPNHCYFLETECLKKVRAKATPKATRKPRKPTVGDTVRLIEDFDGSGMVGELAVIKEAAGSMIGIEFINKMPSGGHTCSDTCKLGHGWNVPKDCVELVTKSKMKKELAIDPRTFYKILRIDGAPANKDARATGFKYTLPVDGETEWTPTIEDIVTCEKGYHVIDAEYIQIWLGSYDEDLIVCEAKARGEIKPGLDKYVAQSIRLTKILCRWNDVRKVFEKERVAIEQEARKRYNPIWEEVDAKMEELFSKLVIGG